MQSSEPCSQPTHAVGQGGAAGGVRASQNAEVVETIVEDAWGVRLLKLR